jgi:hypothetical protein
LGAQHDHRVCALANRSGSAAWKDDLQARPPRQGIDAVLMPRIVATTTENHRETLNENAITRFH